MNVISPLGPIPEVSVAPEVVVENVRVSVGNRSLLDNVSVRLGGGGCTAILGANGAGKSVLLRVCHGLMAPDRGEVLWDGQLLSRQHLHRQAMVFQRPVMLRRTALANVSYPLRLRGLVRSAADTRAAASLEEFGLAYLADRPARLLSGGEQQRLALARAWAVRPDVLLLDEPTASLDTASTMAVEADIQVFIRAGTKVVLVTHHLSQAKRLAQDVVLMSNGRVLEQTNSHEFFENPRTNAAKAFLSGDYSRMG